MDKLTVTGLILAFVAVVGGSILKGSGVSGLLNPAAFVIVIVGTCASITIHTPMATVKHAFKVIRWAFRPPATDLQGTIKKLVEWSTAARKQGLLSLEPIAAKETDPFVKRGLQMLVDGQEPDAIREILEVEVGAKEHHDTAAAKMFEGMGIYAPTLGIIGAVLGLMSVMKNLADPSKLGSGIAAAFVATIYGIGIANLFLLPVASKLKSVIKEQTQSREMIIEGLIAIAKGENPRNIESKLQGYLH
jgi:chemotaxis protein MotA